jgi:hypothetical protein
MTTSDEDYDGWADGLEFADRVQEDPMLLAQALDCLFPRDVCEEILRVIERTELGSDVADILREFWADNDATHEQDAKGGAPSS